MIKLAENNKKNAIMGNKVYEIDDVFKLIDGEIRKKGWKRGDLARALNQSESTLSKIMNKQRRLTVKMLFDIANVLGIDPLSLLPGGNPDKKPDLEDYIWSVIEKRLDEYLKKRENKT